MRDTRRVRGWSAEGDAKNLVLVVVFQGKQLSAGLAVTIKPRLGIDFGKALFANQFKAVSCHGLPHHIKDEG